MPSIRHRSKPAKTPLVLLAMLFTFLAVIAVRPAAGLAAPLEPAEPPQLVFAPGSYDFGLQPVNSGTSVNLQLRNAGSEAVHIDSIQVTGSGSNAFWTNSMCPGMTLQPNESCWVQAYFNPQDMTDYAAQLTASSGSYTFSAGLTGTGGRAIFSPASNPTDFGSTAVGSAGTTREITVTNTGNMPGGAFIAVIAGGAVGSFQLLDENCTGHMLVPAATCTLQVRFRPLSEGVKTAMLGLFGEQDGGTQIVLTGVGSAPAPTALQQPHEAGPATAVASPDPLSPRSKRHKRPLRLHRRHSRVALDAGRVLTRNG